MSKNNFELIQPKASALLDSLRSFGYSLTDAVADLIDNSIAARASKIKINFKWDGKKSSIQIIDNGSGMSYPTLVNAMSLGVNGPSQIRKEDDLGRFGLGMKTASLSQGKRLKVYSCLKSKQVHGLCWDLDHVAEKNEWSALKLSNDDFKDEMILDFETGTVLILETLDRVINLETSEQDTNERKHFYEAAQKVQSDLGIIFHRYLLQDKLKISFNNDSKVIPYDPLHLDKESTNILCDKQVFRFDGSKAKVTSVILNNEILENEIKLNIDSTWKHGVIVYRNDRIVSWGKWLNLASSNNHDHKFFRCSVDFKSSEDRMWNIDVKKTTVNVPRSFAKQLKPLIKSGLNKSREIVWNNIFIKKDNANSGQIPLWLSAIRRGQNILIINRDFPLVQKIYSNSTSKKDLEMLLKIIETSLTLNEMNSDKDESDLNSPKEIVQDTLQELGLSSTEIDSLYHLMKLR